jgi:hypothetical protein
MLMILEAALIAAGAVIGFAAYPRSWERIGGLAITVIGFAAVAAYGL